MEVKWMLMLINGPKGQLKPAGKSVGTGEKDPAVDNILYVLLFIDIVWSSAKLEIG